MLVDEQYSNVLPLLRKVIKGLFNRGGLGFGIDD